MGEVRQGSYEFFLEPREGLAEEIRRSEITCRLLCLPWGRVNRFLRSSDRRRGCKYQDNYTSE
jgi:hypothetical protein